MTQTSAPTITGLSKLINLLGQYCIITEKAFDSDYKRVRVQHWIPGLSSGDKIRWNPKMNLDSLATYEVIHSWPHYARKGVWFAELGKLEPDVTIAGVRYKAPSQGFLMPIETFHTIRIMDRVI